MFITVIIVLATNYPGWFLVAIFFFHTWAYSFWLAMSIMIAPLVIVSILTLYVGAKRLSRPMS
jgi:uncharacterized protein (DUF983 family)